MKLETQSQLKRNEAQSAWAESTNKGVNFRSLPKATRVFIAVLV